jgi:hypothetical protein
VCYVGLNVLRLAPHSLLDLRAAAPGSKWRFVDILWQFVKNCT